jgi:hypothetical protein
VPLRRADDPDRWWEAAVVTQVDDRQPAGPDQRGRYITSSASQPDVVALMLDALDAAPYQIETAYHWWCAAGRPGPQQWRITIIPQGQLLTLTEPTMARA